MPDRTLHTERALLGYFHDALQDARRRQRLATSDAALHYLSRLLADYARSDRLFDDTRDGRRIQPLALLYGQALAAETAAEQRLLLRRLGDVALFIGGLFGGRLQRRLVDLDYCVKMGAGAYGQLSDLPSRQDSGALPGVYRELAQGFGRFVALLTEIGARRHGAVCDPLRLYELWQQSRSPALAERLAALGLAPVAGAPGTRH